ncbi:MAG: DUF6452 family protein [Phocaeicola sp.]
MNKLLYFLLLIGATSTLLLGCSESDCPLIKISYANFSFLDSETHQAVKFTQDITVTGFVVKDTLISDTLFNKPESSMSLPLSYTEKTTYVMHYTDLMKDTIEVYHQPRPFVGNIECNPMVFYTVQSVTYTRHALDSVVIVNPDITNEEKNNFQIFYSVSN